MTSRPRPPVPRPPFDRVWVVGGGLLGASVALALRDRAAARAVEVVEPDEESRRRLAARGLSTVPRLSSLDGEPEAVWLAAPPSAIESGLAEVARVAPEALVTDVASVKRSVLAAAREVRRRHPDFLFVGSHPMAGGQRSGPDAADPGLFVGCTVALCPLAGVPPAALAGVERAWQLLGALPLVLSAEEHDAIVAVTSHLPQVVASALALYVARHAGPGSSEEHLLGPGFRDTTRLAASASELWAEILERNADELRPHLRACGELLLQWSDPAGAAAWRERLGEARAFRRRLEGE